MSDLTIDFVSLMCVLEDCTTKTIAVVKWFAGLVYLLSLLCYTAGREYGPQLNRNIARLCGKVYGYGRVVGKKYFEQYHMVVMSILTTLDYEIRSFITTQFGTGYSALRTTISPVVYVHYVVPELDNTL
jgi:uncharacterized membrane protein